MRYHIKLHAILVTSFVGKQRELIQSLNSIKQKYLIIKLFVSYDDLFNIKLFFIKTIFYMFWNFINIHIGYDIWIILDIDNSRINSANKDKKNKCIWNITEYAYAHIRTLRERKKKNMNEWRMNEIYLAFSAIFKYIVIIILYSKYTLLIFA